MATIAVIGAGFSGTLLALHLLRRCTAETKIVLIERNGQFGRGTAYATGNPNHLLNVAAGRMSAFQIRPDHFLEWLQAHTDEFPGLVGCAQSTFVPRGVYGAYIRDLLNQEIGLSGNLRRLDLVRGQVLALDDNGQSVTLELDRARTFVADIVVLATGHFPPEAPASVPPQLLVEGYYRPDPWLADTWQGLDPEAPVLILGTGLTMVDSVISLLDQGHRGPIHALSRRGLLPARHVETAHRQSARPNGFPTRLTALTRCLRRRAVEAEAAGLAWQPIVDSLRPFTEDIWLALSADDRARFLRHLRPWWDIHRHRMAPAVAARITAARHSGQLQIHAGRIRAIERWNDGVRVSFSRRRGGGEGTLEIVRIVNASGPACDFDRVTDPLMRNLLDTGAARPDPLGLGLDVTVNGAVRDRDGAITGRLFAIGPLTKGVFWEVIAVPDIRKRCVAMAGYLSPLA
jgi:uncharacterized NAD(P)/FAD-binding protein YdhS